jgi:hypothetical protein
MSMQHTLKAGDRVEATADRVEAALTLVTKGTFGTVTGTGSRRVPVGRQSREFLTASVRFDNGAVCVCGYRTATTPEGEYVGIEPVNVVTEEIDLNTEAEDYPCKQCGKDIGWNAPSGVCSEACLRAAQGLNPPAEQPTAYNHNALNTEETTVKQTVTETIETVIPTVAAAAQSSKADASKAKAKKTANKPVKAPAKAKGADKPAKASKGKTPPATVGNATVSKAKGATATKGGKADASKAKAKTSPAKGAKAKESKANPDKNTTTSRRKSGDMLRAQERILICLSKSARPMTRKEIADKTPCDISFMTSWLGSNDPEKRAANDIRKGYTSLISLGYIKSEDVEVDGRKVVVYSATAKGRQVAKNLS